MNSAKRERLIALLRERSFERITEPHLPWQSHLMPRCPWALFAGSAIGIGLFATSHAFAEEQAEARHMSQQEIEAWLDARAVSGTRDVGAVEEQPEAPPPPPRQHGLVLESSIGAIGHLGPMKNVSPTSPWFHVQLGFEPLAWLMVFGESDVAFSTTSYTKPPPDPRAYALFGFGGGLRFTLKPTDRFGVYAQGSLGMARVSDDVLFIYGYTDADELNMYFGGSLGLEWYQINPHYALSVHGGIRDYPDLFARQLGGETPLVFIGGASLRYTF